MERNHRRHYHHHHHHQYEEEAAAETLTPSQLLQLSETHLRLRNFSLSHDYALQSHHPHDPHRHLNHLRALQLTTISTILSSSTSPDVINWYSILLLDTFCSNLDVIRSHYNHLLSLLNPIKDSFPFANDALGFVVRAFNCLSNPNSKSQFDSRLKSIISSGGNRGNNGEYEGRFWTSCPYCYYVYEYDGVYEGCCLRCPNEFCRKAFHGFRLGNLPPKVDFDKGVYIPSFGYFPLGFSPSELGLKGKFGSWSPVVGFHPAKVGKDAAGGGDGGGGIFLMIVVVSGVGWSNGKINDNDRGYEGEGNDDVDMGGFENRDDIDGGDSSAVNDTNDVNFFEGEGEIFVGLDPDDA